MILLKIQLGWQNTNMKFRCYSRLIHCPETPELEKEQPLPRLSPRAPLRQLEQMLHTYLGPFGAE